MLNKDIDKVSNPGRQSALIITQSPKNEMNKGMPQSNSY